MMKTSLCQLTALPLLPSSSDELVSIPLKALIVDFRICCWIRLKERNIDNWNEGESPKSLNRKRLSCEKIYLALEVISYLIYFCRSYSIPLCQNTNETPENRREFQSEGMQTIGRIEEEQMTFLYFRPFLFLAITGQDGNNNLLRNSAQDYNYILCNQYPSSLHYCMLPTVGKQRRTERRQERTALYI
jgi:hypothetical protein